METARQKARGMGGVFGEGVASPVLTRIWGLGNAVSSPVRSGAKLI